MRYKKITPHLWFATEAVEAAQFYASMFPNAKETEIKNTPSISFLINFDPSVDEEARELLDDVWEKLI